MPLSPAEIRHTELQRGVFGYRRGQVEQLQRDVVESFEEVWRERADLAERVEQLESELQRHRDVEALLRTTLVSAERAGEELKEQARREADLVLSESHAEARAIDARCSRGARAPARGLPSRPGDARLGARHARPHRGAPAGRGRVKVPLAASPYTS